MVQRGRQSSVAVADHDAQRAGAGSLSGDATMAPQGLTFGRMVDGGFAGKFAAQYRKVAGTAATTYNIPHSLGFVPAWCLLVAYDNTNTPNTFLVAGPNQYDKWTASEIRVRVNAIIGGIAGSQMWFLIGGER